MRIIGFVVAGCLLGSQAACDQVDEWRAERGDSGRLSLSLEAPETLDWGGTGTIRLALENQGGSETEGATVEVHLPDWLEFGSVEPSGTEVTLLTGEEGTRLSYRLTAPLEAGERREIVQHVRVPAAGAATDAHGRATAPEAHPDTLAPHSAADTAALGTRPPPTNRTMRARLVSATGDVVGAEVQAVLSFRGAEATEARAQARGTGEDLVRDDRVGDLRLGMTAEDLRREIPGARDTTVTLPDGTQERAVLVPIGDDRSVAAVVTARGVEQIIVRDPGFSTERGIGVGSRLSELRSAYGQACAEPFGDRRVAVRFPAAPGVIFGLSATAPADTAELRQDPAQLPDTARVTEIRVQEGRAGC